MFQNVSHVCDMICTCVDEMSAYAKPMHLICGMVKDIASVIYRTKNQVRKRRKAKKIISKT